MFGSRSDPQGLAVEGWLTVVKSDGSYQAQCPSGFGKGASGTVGPASLAGGVTHALVDVSTHAAAVMMASPVDPWPGPFADQCTP
jgi:hypothetical protein